jgi:RNA polymerase sigma factor (sigma-70 family)
LVPARDATNLTDHELLDRFITRREEAAFEALLQRHGPLVFGVCRRVLHSAQDAEDAFQATFLVLVRKAASIAKRASLRSWLYGVAYRVAVKARMRALQRTTHENRAVNRSTSDPVEEILWQDLRPVLDEEVNRLPEKYRAPVILCYLEGLSYAEAAAELGCSKGTIALRLEQARDQLRNRLSRRGVALSLAQFAALLTPSRIRVPAPDALRTAAVELALFWALGGTSQAPAAAVSGSAWVASRAVPASISALAEGVLSALVWARLKIAAAIILAALVVCGSAGAVVYRMLSEGLPPDAGAPAPLKKGRKTLQDRWDGILPPNQGSPPRK